MTMRNVAEGLKKAYLSRSELILRNLPKFVDGKQFEIKYNDFLSNMKVINTRNASNFLFFPSKALQRFPHKMIENLIKSSYKVIKEKKAINHIEVYNSVLKSYLKHDVEGDLPSLLSDMKTNKVHFNDKTYVLLIDLYGKQGDMEDVENLLNLLKSHNISLTDDSKYRIYGGYIRAEKYEEAKQFLKEHNFDENCIGSLLQKSKAYADIGNFEEVMKTIKKIEEIDKNLPSKISLGIYRRLVKAKISDTDLEKVLALTNESINPNIVYNTVFYLNRFGFFKHSLNILMCFRNLFLDGNIISEIISSFNNVDCPINIYKTVLENFSSLIHPNVSLNLFGHLEYDEASKLIEDIVTTSNFHCLLSNLLMKTIKDKSIPKIKETLNFSFPKVNFMNYDTIIQFVLIPALLENDIVSKPQDILQLLPQHKNLILPSLFMYFLSKGDFVSFEDLLENHHSNSLAMLKYSNLTRTNAKIILDNVPFKEIDKLALTAAKVFSPQFVNWLVGSVICEKIIQNSIWDNVSGIEDAIKMAKSFGTSFGKKDIEYLESHVPRHLELIKELEIEEMGTSNDHNA